MIRFANYILIVVFALGAIIPHSDRSQLLKLSEFFEHYELHQAEDKLQGIESTFFDFFVEHMVEEPNHAHDDSEDHEDLPFQQFNTTSVQCILFASNLNTKQVQIHATDTLFASINCFIDRGHSAAVFHPPIV